MVKRLIPIDTTWKEIIVRGVKYIVPNFGEMRNRLRRK